MFFIFHKINYKKIPKELKELPNWVNWKYIQGRKVPFTPQGKPASCNDMTTWSPYWEVAKLVNPYKNYDGIGIQLGTKEVVEKSNRTLVGIDIDNCVGEGGEFSSFAFTVLNLIGSYSEISPSGTGIRIFAWSKFEEPRLLGRKHSEKNIEIYNHSRYLTVTGNHIEGTPRDVLDCSIILTRIYDTLFREKELSKPPVRSQGQIYSNEDVILRVRRSNSKSAQTIKKLWLGDWSDYNSQSSADLAMCNALAFWTNYNAAQIDQLFKNCGLMRAKWNERRGSKTYGELTIERALRS